MTEPPSLSGLIIRPPQKELLLQCHELKVVIHDSDDLAFTKTMAKATGGQTLLPMQPGSDSAGGQHLAVEHDRR